MSIGRLRREWLHEPTVELEARLFSSYMREGLVEPRFIAALAALKCPAAMDALGADEGKIVFGDKLYRVTEINDAIRFVGQTGLLPSTLALIGVIREQYTLCRTSTFIEEYFDALCEMNQDKVKELTRRCFAERILPAYPIVNAIKLKRKSYATNMLITQQVRVADFTFYQRAQKYLRAYVHRSVQCE